MISDTVPTYRQLNPRGFFCEGDFLIEEGAAFEFDGEPNEHMEPLNEPARQRLVSYLKRLDAGAREVAEKNNRAYVGRSSDLADKIAEATADARRIELRPGDGGIPVMRPTNKDVGHIKTVTLETAPPVYRRPKRVREVTE